MSELLEGLLGGVSLTREQAAQVMHRFADGGIGPPLGGALLAALRAKGESADELAGFAGALIELAERPALDAGEAVDIVGTGGDGSASYNLSTGAALLVRACGVPVVKHGNRSVSSRSGSADVLERLGIELAGDAAQAAAQFERHRFTFLFAPGFHPALARVGALRRELGVRTVFNLLGPLANPAEPGYRMLGAATPQAAEAMAHALAGGGLRRGFVVHADNGWDEPTPVGPFTLYDVGPGAVARRRIDPAELGYARCSEQELRGAEPERNADALRAVLEGRERGAHRDALVLGAGLALVLVGEESRHDDARERAECAIDDGEAARLLQRLARAAV